MRPIGTTVCSTQLQLPAPPRWEFVPIEPVNSRQWSAGTCFTFAPTAQERRDTGEWGSALQVLYLIATNCIGATLSNND
jgi:hypothetical protein